MQTLTHTKRNPEIPEFKMSPNYQLRGEGKKKDISGKTA